MSGLCSCALAAGSRAGSSTGAVPAIITGLTTGRFGESSGACGGTRAPPGEPGCDKAWEQHG